MLVVAGMVWTFVGSKCSSHLGSSSVEQSAATETQTTESVPATEAASSEQPQTQHEIEQPQEAEPTPSADSEEQQTEGEVRTIPAPESEGNSTVEITKDSSANN